MNSCQLHDALKIFLISTHFPFHISLTLRVGSVNVGTMRGREGEVVEMAASRHLDFCCLQETGWKGEGTRKLGVISSFGWGVRKGIMEWGCWWLKNGSRRFWM